MNADGFALCHNVLSRSRINSARTALAGVARRLGARSSDLDEIWCEFKRTDRSKGGLLYNAAKLLPEIHQLAVAPPLLSLLRLHGMEQPVLADVNFRIDSEGEDQFLFDWHQDYWFSVCSPNAIVCWVPLMPVTTETGGVELISNLDTGGRIFATTAGAEYRSYADAVKLDEAVPKAEAHRFEMSPGDVLLFKFNVLHRSLPVRSPRASRWTLQARFADLSDPEFLADAYKPTRVTPELALSLKRENAHVE